MYDNIKIVQSRSKDKQVTVYDGDVVINHGKREVDANFAKRVYNTMLDMGYKPLEKGIEVTFNKCVPQP